MLRTMDVISLQDQSIVIIGGTSGLGLSGALACLNAGANVVVAGRDDEYLEAARTQLGNAAVVISGDAMQPELAQQAVETAVERFGALHGLYHVAGGSGRRMGDGPLHEASDEGWDYTLQLNLTSMFYSNRAALKQLMKQQQGGAILNLSSSLWDSPSPAFFSTHAYATAKAAVVGMVRATSAYYAPHDIRINALAPGLTETPMSKRAFGDDEIMQFAARRQPLQGGRGGQPSDLDAAVVYFLSDASRYVTGQVLAVDGGWSVCDGERA
ncbi:MAG: SDR family oxidoreductase [Candidatus Hinthialibacter antarcticus]|nr:SDR family oxidoreductase [Candidatus Hinthialibacter antarcticus]